MPEVSIITACYNTEKFIEDTIKSVINQSYKDWEWIIVDDCSTDGSVNIIKKYTDDRIKLIESKTNKGASEARNLGLEKAKGRYIAFIDSDDVWDLNSLEKRINYLRNAQEQAVYTSYRRADENLNIVLKDFIAEDNVNYKRMLQNCPVFISTLVYDTQKSGIIKFPEVHRREDYAMFFDLLKNVKIIRALKEPLVTYRIRNNSYSRNKWLMFKLQFLVYYKFLKLPLYKSLYYTTQWAINGLIKYERI